MTAYLEQNLCFDEKVTLDTKLSILPEIITDEIDLKESDVIGDGAYGTVYKYKNYALKVSKIREINDDFIREISILIHLSHPNIISINKIGLKFSLMMPLMKSNLSDVLRKYKVPTKDKNLYIYQLLMAVDYLHSRGVIHRDLKPGNLLIDQDNNLKIADFGTAIALSCVKNTLMAETVTTLWYRAPEVLENKTYDENSDKWAVGLIIYEIYNEGEAVFSGIEDEKEMLAEISNRKMQIRKGENRVPSIIRNISLSLLTYDPEKRSHLSDLAKDELFDETRAFIPLVENKRYNCVENLELRSLPIPMLSDYYDEMKYVLIYVKEKMYEQVFGFKLNPRSYFLGCYILYQYLALYELTEEEIKLSSYYALYLADVYNFEGQYYVLNPKDFKNFHSNPKGVSKVFDSDTFILEAQNIFIQIRGDITVATVYDFAQELDIFEEKKHILVLLTMMKNYETMSYKEMALYVRDHDDFDDILRKFKDELKKDPSYDSFKYSFTKYLIGTVKK